MGTEDDKHANEVIDINPAAVPERIVVALIDDAERARDRLIARTGGEGVDVDNRALQLYDEIDAELHAGAEIVLVYPSGRAASLRFTIGTEHLGKKARPQLASRIKTSLIGQASEALDRIVARRGLSKVDVLNLALQAYDRIDEERSLGATVTFWYADGRTKILTYE